MGSDDERDYEVGYGKPPKNTRFKRGTSGNPAGRPRGSKNLNTLLNEELEQRVVVRENGREKRITKRQASVKQIVNKLAAGDPRFIPFFIRLLEKQEIQASARGAVDADYDQVIDPEVARQLQEAWKTIRDSQPAITEESGPLTAEKEEKEG
jgi:hypothetical protein